MRARASTSARASVNAPQTYVVLVCLTGERVAGLPLRYGVVKENKLAVGVAERMIGATLGRAEISLFGGVRNWLRWCLFSGRNLSSDRPAHANFSTRLLLMNNPRQISTSPTTSRRSPLRGKTASPVRSQQEPLIADIPWQDDHDQRMNPSLVTRLLHRAGRTRRLLLVCRPTTQAALRWRRYCAVSRLVGCIDRASDRRPCFGWRGWTCATSNPARAI